MQIGPGEGVEPRLQRLGQFQRLDEIGIDLVVVADDADPVA
nr:hypothetical protein [Rhizobium sp. G21]